jgi:hypothetical protein
MVIEKSRERVPIWKSFAKREDVLPSLFLRVVKLRSERDLSTVESTVLVQFLINAFEGLEHPLVCQVPCCDPVFAGARVAWRLHCSCCSGYAVAA